MNSFSMTACLSLLLFSSVGLAQAQPKGPSSVREIAKEATIYGYPMVDNYRIIYDQYVNKSSSTFKAPIGQIKNENKLAGPKDTSIQTINADTPYSYALIDLRTEPFVLTLPKVTDNRYYSVQLIDLYTYNADYIGTRKDGNAGGNFLITGPNWKGKVPKDIRRVIPIETQMVTALFRTQLFNPKDIREVEKIQAGYRLQPLSAFIKQPAPAAAPAVDFIAIDRKEMQEPERFFAAMSLALSLSPILPEEKALRTRFSQIGVDGSEFNFNSFNDEMKKQITAGFRDGMKAIDEAEAQITSSLGLFGTRKEMKNNYLNRAAAAKAGIYGNSSEEAVYLGIRVDDQGELLDGAKHSYTMYLPKNDMPPVHGFWSFTIYSEPQKLLVNNPLDRYLINSSMLRDLKKDASGGILIYVQNSSPGKERESNWLPAPKGPFMVVTRLYLPSPEAQQGRWQAPEIKRVTTSLSQLK